ncbi:hypothetical protein D3C81_995740 [compost metagenome]
MIRTVHECGFEQILRQLADEVVHEIRHQRQTKGGMSQPDAKIASVQPKGGIILKHWNQGYLNRDDQHRNDNHEQCFAAREPEPSESVCGKRSNQHWNYRCRYSNSQCIPECLGQAGTLLRRFTAVCILNGIFLTCDDVLIVIQSQIRAGYPALLLDTNYSCSAVLPDQTVAINLDTRLELVVRISLAVNLNRSAQIHIFGQLNCIPGCLPLLVGQHLPPTRLKNIRSRPEGRN